MKLQPDFAWYVGQSKALGLSPRCPFASVHRCPRYYMSLALLGRTGAATPVDGEERLKKRWERDELLPVTMEQTPAW